MLANALVFIRCSHQSSGACVSLPFPDDRQLQRQQDGSA